MARVPSPADLERDDDLDSADLDPADHDSADLDRDDVDPADLDRDDVEGDGRLAGLPVDRPGAATRALAVWLVVAGAVGGLAAFVLSWDKVKLLENPDTHLACNISPFISCGSVMVSRQAAAFGFPNSFLGVAGFAVLLAIGAGLLAGGAFRRWFWVGLQAGVVAGLALVVWLVDQSVFHIHALCPWCMVVWSVMIPTFLVVTAYNLRAGHLGRSGVPAGRVLTRHLGEVVVAAFAVVVALAGVEFWPYWQSLL